MRKRARQFFSKTIGVLLITSAAGWVGKISAAPSPNQDLAFDTEDMDFILKQIKFAERHAAGEKLSDILPNASVPWGLRTVDGSFNSLLPGQTKFGAADEFFPTRLESTFRGAQLNDAGAPTTYASDTDVTDATPRLISQLISNQSTSNPAAAIASAQEGGENIGPGLTGIDQFFIPNTAPDEGLSAPINGFLTFFGQFFDHGLDLVNKGGNGFVMMPLQPDDPLYDDSPGAMNFMAMPRATQEIAPDGTRVFKNATTPHVDQQQTYGSHASAQIFLRQYELRSCLTRPLTGCLQSTGQLLNGYGTDGTLDSDDDGGMATWDTAQAQAELKLGISLDDFDGANIPMIMSDEYGNFIPGPVSGLPQIVLADPMGELLEGNLENPIDASRAARVNHSFFLDVAHSAAPKGTPDSNTIINLRTDILSGQTTRGIRASGEDGTYDDELLGVHFVCGDGRCNENIALTTIHTIFHSEHNRLSYVAKRVLLDDGDLTKLNQWLDTDLRSLPAAWTTPLFSVSDASLENQQAARDAIDALNLDWNGERIFQAARFGTEMQYNRIVFDEFAPTLAGLKDVFEGFHPKVDPTIMLGFAQSVYRFGHSLLTQTVDRFDENFDPITDTHTGDASQLGLFEAFLNPLALYNAGEDGVAVLTPEAATGAVIRGLTRTTANEIDEFVTGALQNNLVGLPLDLGAINIARGRDVGLPSLNAARRTFFDVTQDTRLTPYASWIDYADNLRHEESLVNFIAAYGTHPTLAGLDADNTYSGRRAAACAIVSALSTDAATYCRRLGFTDGPAPATVVTQEDLNVAIANAAVAQAAATAATQAASNAAAALAAALALRDAPTAAAGQAVEDTAAQLAIAIAAAVSAQATADTANVTAALAAATAAQAAEAAAAAALGTPGGNLTFSGTVNGRGRITISGACPNAAEVVADDPGVNCNFIGTRGSFRCRGIRLPTALIGQTITATCLVPGADAIAAANAAAAATAAADAEAISLEAASALASAEAIAEALALSVSVAQTNADAAVAVALALAAADTAAADQAVADAVAVVLLSEIEAAAALGAATAAQAAATAAQAAFAIITPDQTTPLDSLDFLYSRGEWASDAGGVTITGLDAVDFWIGGLAEERMPFGGYLGSTHNFVFETQIESLQNGDRFYYVARTGTIHLFSELESNSFTALVMRNTNLGENGGGSLPLNIFVTQNHILEVDQSQQFNAAGDGTTADPTDGTDLIALVIRDAASLTTNIDVPDTTRVLQYTGGDHVTIGGTVGSDTIIGGIGDDTLIGREGADRIEGGDGADLIEGGAGDDIITDLSGPDVIEGGAGNDAISSGNEEDVIFGDDGNDFIVNSSEFGEIFGGLGDDYIFDGFHNGHIRGGAGDDWMENLGGGEDLFQGDNGAAPEAGEPAIKGNDVGISYDGNNDWDMENGDDIVIDGPGIDRVEGQLGFDWVSFVNDESGVDVDLDLTIFNKPILPPSNDTVNNRYDRVEGISGSSLADILAGTANSGGDDRGNELVNFGLIMGLDVLVPLSERRQLQPDVISGAPQFGWAGGEIILGGGGSDLLIGEGGNDIIDGDASLRVAISTPDPAIRSGSLGQALRTAKVAASSAGSQADLDQVAVDGFGVALAAAQAATESAVNAAAEARIAVDLLEDSKVGLSEMTVTGALGNLIGAAMGDNGQPFTEALFSFLDLCASTLAEAVGFDVDATAAKTAQEAAVLASETVAEQAALTLVSVEATRDLSAAAVAGFQEAESAAQAALDLMEPGNILVDSMQDIMGAVFAGDINPGELSIFRGIIYDEGLSVDSALYSGARADYTIELAFTRADGTSVIRVTDNRPLPRNAEPGILGSDGTDLVSNVERLVFSDGTFVLFPTDNSVAMGDPTISGTQEAGMTLTASMTGVTDADNVSADNPDGAITGTVDFTWEIEGEPGSGAFAPLLADDNGNGDFAEVHGQNLILTNAEAGLRVRVEAIFQDEAKVWEIVRSVPVTIVAEPGAPL